MCAKESIIRTTILLSVAIACYGCYGVRPSSGGAEANTSSRKTNPSDIALPPGYRAEVVATGLTFPTSITFDETGNAYVVESGYSYGEKWTEPKLLKVESSGKTSVIATGKKNGPWNGVVYHDGNFYVAEGGEMDGGKILRISKNGDIRALVENLPSTGDHHTNGPLIHDGYIYFGQGTATNSGVVGEDNAKFGWLKRKPDFHDTPCRDVVLAGTNYESLNPVTADPDDKATTGAFVPFNTPTTDGQVVEGTVPCSGAIMRIPIEGGDVELVAWGFRNPYGLAVHDGQLFVVENGFDERGSRPVWGTGDILWQVEEGQWYGWPDYSGTHPLSDDLYKVPGKASTKLVLKEKPNEVPDPVAVLGVHSSSNGMDFSDNNDFGYHGWAFIAQLGDMSPNVGKVMGPVGFKVVMVNVSDGIMKDFAVNKGKRNAPASVLKSGGLERPVAVRFHPEEKALYVVDFGILEIDDTKTISREHTGVIWKISKQK